jgi:hypothetical protein
MADDIAPTPTEFEVALRALLEDIEPPQTREALNNAGAAPKRTPVPAVNTIGGKRMPAARYMTQQEQTMQERPWVQMGRDAGALATSAIDTAGLGLPGVALDFAAPNVLSGIRENERLANPGVTGVGTVAGAIGMQPRLALSALGGAYAAAGADQLGLIDGMSSAEAQTRLTRDQRRAMEMEKQRAERDAAIQQRAADAQAKRDLETEAKRKDREEYDRAVTNAEGLAAKEMARDRRFSDTPVGRVYDATGGLAPAAAGFVGAKMSRLATGPGATMTGQIIKDYGLPLTTGTVSGAITANLPLAYNALATEPDNPKRRMYEALAENLPAGHPKRQEAIDRLQDTKALPEANPIRSAASAEFYDPQKMQERLIMGGVEGFGGGLLGTDFVRAVSRGAKGAANRLWGQGDAQPIAVPAGVVIDGTPAARGALAAPAGAPQIAGPTQPGTLAAGGQPLPQPQLPAPAVPANPRPTYQGHPLPPGAELRSDGYPYDIRTGHPLPKKLFEGR